MVALFCWTKGKRMDSSIINAIIGGGIAVAVCLINNYVILKKHRIETQEKAKEQIDAIKKEINDNMADVTARLEEVIANQETYQMSMKKDMDFMVYRVSSLESKMDKHNNVIERTYNLETTAKLLVEKIDVANHRISDLEHGDDRK